MLKKYTIYGERTSGTTYLKNIIDKNFDIKLTWEYGWKHFFGFNDEKLKNSDDTLFICIIRDPFEWINSLFREKHHLPLKYKTNLTEEEKLDEFLNKEVFSVNDADYNYKKWDKELMIDRNIYTGERYKNIFELRHTKIKWMIEDLPKKVNNYIFIQYEDLLNNFENTILKIKNKGLKVKPDIIFPINICYYKDMKNTEYKKKEQKIESKIILSNPNFISYYEKKLGYI
jgi:nicotinamide riboside kinase